MVEKKKDEFTATGRRKTAVARVRLLPGTGKWKVNKTEIQAYFCSEALVKYIAEAHGGRATVESPVGGDTRGGSLFRVFLPAPVYEGTESAARHAVGQPVFDHPDQAVKP